MAKNKASKKEADIDKDEVTYEEEVGGKEEKGASGEGGSFFDQYKNYIYIGGAAIIAIIAYLYFQNNGKSETEMEALGEMAMAEVYFQQDSIQKSIVGDAQFMGFEMVEQDYAGTDAANLANYYIGTGKLKLGQIDEGIGYLEDFEKGDNMISAAAYAALGYAYEQKLAFGEAAEYYEKASKTPEENAVSTPFYLMDAARNYESADNVARALEIYKRIKKDYPQSEQVTQGNVDKYIAKLDLGSDV